MFTITILILPLLITFLYQPFDTGNFNGHSRILVLTAHPDDECMFFAPTILGLNTKDNIEISSLCLSVGNADGLGITREMEFHASYEVLGVPAGRRWIVDHPDLLDNFTITWDSEVISKAIYNYIVDNNIDTILTFDYEGISSHPNHKSLPHGVTYLIQTLHDEGRPTPRLYVLVTIPIFTKYTSVISPLLTKFDLLLARVLNNLINFIGKDSAMKHDPQANARGIPVFVSGVPEYLRMLHAMRMHQSQLIWFRWLYMLFSRYMWVNEWSEVKVH